MVSAARTSPGTTWNGRRRLALAAALALSCGAATGSAGTNGTTSAAAAQTRPAKPAATAAPAPETLKERSQELDAVREQQRQATEAEQRLANEKDAVAEDRRRLSQSLIDTAARIRSDEERAAEAEAHLRQLEASETEIRQNLDGRRTVLAEVMAALQRIAHRPGPPIFASTEDAIESLRAAMSLGAVLPEMRSEVAQLAGELSGLARVKKEGATERDRLAGDLAELAEAQKGMTSLIEERQKRQSEIEQAIGAERQKVLALARQADNLKDLIAKLEQRLDTAARASRATTKPADDARPTGDLGPGLAALRDPGRLTPAIAFVAAKGKLSLPASGVKIRDFGASDGIGGTEKGVSLATRPGAQVTAPSDGWVMYAAPYRSYGQLLILNVGGGYHVLLAGMERITVDLGQFVLTGEPVAVMGSGTQVASFSAPGSSSAIGSSQPVLYIEFRKDGSPVDPTPWWAATENEKVRG
jgi:murein hydrolase activator